MRPRTVILASAALALAAGCGPMMPAVPALPETLRAEAFLHPTGIRFVVLPAGSVDVAVAWGITSQLVLPRSRLLSAHEITNAQYEQFVADCRKRAKAQPKEKEKHDPAVLNHQRAAVSSGDDHPVCNVRPKQAEAFCKWLTETDPLGRQYRLPESETWEYAARGGQPNLVYPWGDQMDAKNACGAATGPKPVGSYPPNPFGLHDMAGNAAEWVKTNDFPQYELRGGAWCDGPDALRIAARGELPKKDATLDHHGFRVLCQPPLLK